MLEYLIFNIVSCIVRNNQANLWSDSLMLHALLPVNVNLNMFNELL
jgi:hypothetical protein